MLRCRRPYPSRDERERATALLRPATRNATRWGGVRAQLRCLHGGPAQSDQSSGMLTAALALGITGGVIGLATAALAGVVGGLGGAFGAEGFVERGEAQRSTCPGLRCSGSPRSRRISSAPV